VLAALSEVLTCLNMTRPKNVYKATHLYRHLQLTNVWLKKLNVRYQGAKVKIFYSNRTEGKNIPWEWKDERSPKGKFCSEKTQFITRDPSHYVSQYFFLLSSGSRWRFTTFRPTLGLSVIWLWSFIQEFWLQNDKKTSAEWKQFLPPSLLSSTFSVISNKTKPEKSTL
jgi:hypothetical protein